MSRASKITLGASIYLCAATCIGVYWLSESERDVSWILWEELEWMGQIFDTNTHNTVLKALKLGPIKDQARLYKRSMSKKQQANREDFEAQKKLKEQLSAEQEVTRNIVTADDDGK